MFASHSKFRKEKILSLFASSTQFNAATEFSVILNSSFRSLLCKFFGVDDLFVVFLFFDFFKLFRSVAVFLCRWMAKRKKER